MGLKFILQLKLQLIVLLLTSLYFHPSRSCSEDLMVEGRRVTPIDSAADIKKRTIRVCGSRCVLDADSDTQANRSLLVGILLGNSKIVERALSRDIHGIYDAKLEFFETPNYIRSRDLGGSMRMGEVARYIADVRSAAARHASGMTQDELTRNALVSSEIASKIEMEGERVSRTRGRAALNIVITRSSYEVRVGSGPYSGGTSDWEPTLGL